MSSPPVYDPHPSDFLWIVVASGIAAFITAFGIGANDVANAFASSVGAKSLKLWQAVIIAAIFEFGGAVLLGASVTSTIRQGIAKGNVFEDTPELFMLGMLCADLGAGLWLLIATRLSLAVSTTHSIVGAIIGVFLVAGGKDSIEWFKVGMIVVSWFTSPILSGIVSACAFLLIRYFFLRSENSLERTIRFYPVLVATTLAINLFFIIYKGAPALGGEKTPFWQGILIAIGSGIVIALLIQFIAIPYIRRSLDKWEVKQTKKIDDLKALEMQEKEKAEKGEGEGEEKGDLEVSASTGPLNKQEPEENAKGIRGMLARHKGRLTGQEMAKESLKEQNVRDVHDNAEVFDEKTERMYTYLQIVTAIFDSFAHGANDVANSIAPFAGCYAVYQTGGIPSKSNVPVWILAMGGGGIVIGLTLYGYRIIQALGMSLTKITPSRGFTIELGTALTVVVFSLIGVPISTTQCQVGSTTAVGLCDGFKGVNSKLLLSTFFSWIVTMIFSGGVAALLFSFAAYAPFIMV